MSMDAVTSMALDTLTQDILLRLSNKLERLKKTPQEKRMGDKDLTFLLSEAFELLKLLEKWAAPQANQNTAEINFGQLDEMSDEEAMAALESMDQGLESPSPKAVEEMSNEEAMAALESMDQGTSSSSSPDTNELSDDEAMRLLAQMDDLSPSPSTASTPPNWELTADEAALSMLATMEDTPSTAAPASLPSPRPAPATSPSPETAAHGQHQATEEIGEINEFAGSEFSSDPEMIKDFMENATELVQSLDEQILVLEANPTSKDTIEEIFRAAHTLKGAAGMFGYSAIERIMHKMENFFDRVRKGQVIASPDAIDVILRGIDLLKTLMQGVSSGKPTGVQTAPLVRELALLGEGRYVKSTHSSSLQTAATKQAAENTVDSPMAGTTGAPSKKANKQEDSTIRVDIKRLDALVNLVGELVTDRTRFMNIEEDLRLISPQLQSTHNMSQTVQLFARHMNEIQDTIMKVRMVPIGNAFNKFGRIVRDLARQLDKEIELAIDGEATELDKTLVEQIGDPLVHLIRNSCDHGVEIPEVRKKSGKKPTGTISLSAKQEGNQIIISIEDDGKGIDAKIIRKKAIEKGMISEDDNLSDKDIFALIFEPGFSTAEQVTNISGRGVGMDVVKRQIMKLKGTIDVDSTVGIGTTITIQLPLTLAIVQSLLVKSKEEIFAIPLTSVVESLRISPKEIQKVGEAEVIKRRNQVLPLYYLDDILDLDSRDNLFWYKQAGQGAISAIEKDKMIRRREERLFVVVVGSADRRFGIVVDTLLNQQEMVIKSMGNLVAGIPCVAGGAILGNGEVVLVLDTGEMDSIIRAKGRMGQAA